MLYCIDHNPQSKEQMNSLSIAIYCIFWLYISSYIYNLRQVGNIGKSLSADTNHYTTAVCQSTTQVIWLQHTEYGLTYIAQALNLLYSDTI